MTSVKNADALTPLGSNLIVRPSIQQDAEDLLQLVNTVFGSMTETGSNTHMTRLVQRIMSGTHPTIKPDSFTLVEDTSRIKRRIVGCVGMLQHIWLYEDVPFLVGRPEIIATYPEYRHQGLIRSIFAMMHERSAAAGHLVQAITGIPYFYRLFDYEYALHLWETCTIDITHLPPIAPETSKYALRDASIEDVPLLQVLYEQQRCKGMISQIVEERWWFHQIQTWNSETPDQNMNSHVQILIDDTQRAVGYIITPSPRFKKYMQIWDFVVTDDVDLQKAMPELLHILCSKGVQEREQLQQEGNLEELRFMLARTHRAFDILNALQPQNSLAAFAWYIRVADIPPFLAHIEPVLASRLTQANFGNFQGELTLDFYRDGLHLVFDKGHITNIERSVPSNTYVKADAGFPPNVFLQLLFGHHTLEELHAIMPDVWVKDEAKALLESLFPKKLSWVLPVW